MGQIMPGHLQVGLESSFASHLPLTTLKKARRKKEKRMTENETVGQCHRSDQHELDPTPGGSGRQEGLACSVPWGHEESDTTKRRRRVALMKEPVYANSHHVMIKGTSSQWRIEQNCEGAHRSTARDPTVLHPTF